MAVVWTILWFVIVGGLLGCLWLIVRRSRRRAARIAAQLAEPIVPAHNRVVVWRSRKANAAFGVFFAFLLAGSIQSLLHGRLWLALVVLLFGWLCVFYVRRAVQRGPALVIDGDGLTVGSSGRSMRWEDVQDLAVREGHSSYGVANYTLVGEVKQRGPDASEPATNEPIDVDLDYPSMSWNDIVEAIEQRYGRRLPVEPA
jgi:hypothetical protein